MTQDEVTRLFHQASEAAGWKPGVGNALVIDYLTHFADLVEVKASSAERNACLQIADDCADADMHASMVANAIRARGAA